MGAGRCHQKTKVAVGCGLQCRVDVALVQLGRKHEPETRRLGLGLASWWLVPRITEQTVLFRFLWLMIFLVDIGRLISMASVGLPLTPFIAFTALEILGAPLFVYWQQQVVQNS